MGHAFVASAESPRVISLSTCRRQVEVLGMTKGTEGPFVPLLLLQNGFYQVAWLVHVDSILNRHLIGEQLQRDNFQHGG